LAHDHARVLLFTAQERHRDVFGRRETLWLTLRDQQIVERRVDGIECGADRNRELASAIRPQVAGLQRNLGKEAGTRGRQCLRCLVHFQRLDLQREIAAQPFGHVALDDDVELLHRFGGARNERREAHAADSHHTPDHISRPGTTP